MIKNQQQTQITKNAQPTDASTGVQNPPVQRYSRDAGNKTLFLIGVIIVLVLILSIFTLLAINKQTSVIMQSKTQSISNSMQRKETSKTIQPINETEEEKDLNAIDTSDNNSDIDDLQNDLDQL